MNTYIPQYHEIRLTLFELVPMFNEYVGNSRNIDIGKTIDIMLRDYFYGEIVTEVLGQQTYSANDRTLVFPFGKGCELNPLELNTAIDNYGDVFWMMADTISNAALKLTPLYTHKPSDCFYKFFPDTLELIVYTPVINGFDYSLTIMRMDGRAVMTVCKDFLPPHLRNLM